MLVFVNSLLLISVIFFNAAAVGTEFEGCDKVLNHLRDEIKAANIKDSQSSRELAKYSNSLIEDSILLPMTSSPGSHVVSLGSGPDIFLPLFIYPESQHFHLIDLLGGWGQGPDDIISEIEHRLSSLSNNVQIDRMDKLEDWRKIEGPLPSPLIWRVRWNTPSHLKEKIFYLHQANFNDTESQTVIASHWDEQGGLGGIVLTGVSASLETYYFFLRQLLPTGFMFTDMLYTNKDGKLSTPEDLIKLERLSEEFHIQNIGNCRGCNFLYTPQTLIIRPKLSFPVKLGM